MNGVDLAQLREANQQLIVAALRDKGLAETALHELDELARDTERQSSLDAARRESQKLESIGVLAGGIAHDLNNVLAGILGNVALGLQALDPAHPTAQNLKQIQKAGLHGRRVVQQILAFARRQPQLLTDLALNPLILEITGLLRSTLPAGVEMPVALGEQPLHVLGDASQIEQVLVNLCTNGWHALDGRAGQVSVRLESVRLDADQARRLGKLAAGRYAHIAVSDTGTGMDAPTMARIFEPFFTTKVAGEGTGLGLAVAHGIVVAHAGAIVADSALGRGSRFDVYLPLHEQAKAQSPTVLATTDHQAHGERILLIDDDDVVLLVAAQLLSNMGYDVTAHAVSTEAVDALRRDPCSFDAVVTDLNMPGFSGLDVAREVASIRPGLPVVISSGNIPQDLHAAARGLGVRALLQKQNMLEEIGPLLRVVLPPANAVDAAG